MGRGTTVEKRLLAVPCGARSSSRKTQVPFVFALVLSWGESIERDATETLENMTNTKKYLIDLN